MPKPLNKEDRKRLGEIISVLRKNDILKGISPGKLRKIMEELGPTFVKVGQLLSMRPELIPQAYCAELANLRTDVAHMDADEVKSIIEAELERPFDDVFSAFDITPVGSASIAQVHKAVLKDGSVVAVKVQRPGIYNKMERDIMLIRRLRSLVRLSSIGNVIDLDMILDEMWESAKLELDFITEADNLDEFSKNNEDILYVGCPKCYQELSTKHLLIMEFIHGIQVDDLKSLKEAGYDNEEIGRKLAANYMKQILEDHFFQADPHPGNIYIEDGRIIWIDMGMMGRVTDFDARCYKAALNAVIEHNYEGMKDVVIMMGVATERFDETLLVEDFERFIGKYEKMALSDINLGHLMTEALQLAADYKIKMPSGVTMVARGITTLEGLLEIIAPDISVISILAVNHSLNFIEDIDLKKEAAKLAKDAVFSSRDLLRIPSRISNTLGRMEKGKIKIKVEPVNIERSVSLISHRIRNLTAGIISAACIISSALFFQSKNPGGLVLSIILLVFGIFLALFAIFSIHKDDRK